MYSYVHNNPISNTDPLGLCVPFTPDVLLDAGFILYDLGALVLGGRKDLEENLLALGADVVGACTPVATGLGLGVRAGKRAIGFAKGLGKSAFSPDRLQHASRHLIDAGILPKYSKSTADQFVRLGTEILEKPAHTFDHVLGGTRVKGFVGKANGRNVVFFVFKEGAYLGKVATAVVPTAQQAARWGIR